MRINKLQSTCTCNLYLDYIQCSSETAIHPPVRRFSNLCQFRY